MSHDVYRFKTKEAATKYADMIRINQALDVSKVLRRGKVVRVEHIGDRYDEGFLFGAAIALDGDPTGWS